MKKKQEKTWPAHCVQLCDVCACMYVFSIRGRELQWVPVNTDLAVIWTAVYLTGYSDHMTGIREQFSPPYRGHIGLNNV